MLALRMCVTVCEHQEYDYNNILSTIYWDSQSKPQITTNDYDYLIAVWMKTVLSCVIDHVIEHSKESNSDYCTQVIHHLSQVHAKENRYKIVCQSAGVRFLLIWIIHASLVCMRLHQSVWATIQHSTFRLHYNAYYEQENKTNNRTHELLAATPITGSFICLYVRWLDSNDNIHLYYNGLSRYKF